MDWSTDTDTKSQYPLESRNCKEVSLAPSSSLLWDPWHSPSISFPSVKKQREPQLCTAYATHPPACGRRGVQNTDVHPTQLSVMPAPKTSLCSHFLIQNTELLYELIHFKQARKQWDMHG